MYDRLQGLRIIKNSEIELGNHYFQICLFEEGVTLWFVWENDRMMSYYCDDEEESINRYLKVHHLDYDTIFSDRGRPVYPTWERIVWFIQSWRLYDV